MKIEILYKDVCNLYGDYYNHIYLERCFKNATIYETTLNETPQFIEEDIDLILDLAFLYDKISHFDLAEKM